MSYIESLEYISLYAEISINYLQAIINTKFMRFTVLYIATPKGGKRLLRKSFKPSLLVGTDFLIGNMVFI